MGEVTAAIKDEARRQLTGMIGFELNGHFAGGFEPADELFAHSVYETMRFVGLSPS